MLFYINILLFLSPIIWSHHVSAMFAKRQREYDLKDIQPEQRFRHNAAELFLDNQVSGERMLSLLEDAQLAGAENIKDLCKGNCKKKGKFRANAARDLLRRLRKNSAWPDLYYAPVRVWDKKTQTETLATLPFLLPHEIAHAFLKSNLKEELLQTSGMSQTALNHLQKMQRNCNAESVLAFGLWVDGAPCNWDRTESLECFSISFPGLDGVNKNLRIPLCAISRRFVIKDHTFQDMLAIVSWSFIHLSQGVFPPRRHDGASFEPGRDNNRQGLAGAAIGVSGFLCEMRGDWKMLSEVLKVPQWNVKSGCCFKCNVKVDEIRVFHRDAEWRKPRNRLDHWGFVQRLLSEGLAISNLFACPGFTVDCIAIDWLHCVDLGVCADFLGNLFWMLLPYQDGANVKERVSSLFLKIQDYYRANKVDNKLNNLTELMIRKSASASPKLRASASEARALVGFAVQEARASLDPEDPIQEAAIQAAVRLAACYQQLSRDSFSQQQLEEDSTAFCLLYGALEANAVAQDLNLWRVKPKFHVFQELCLLPNIPSLNWTYRDEDFGGYLAGSSRRRGGKNTASSTGESVLHRFRAKYKPLLRQMDLQQ